MHTSVTRQSRFAACTEHKQSEAGWTQWSGRFPGYRCRCHDWLAPTSLL